MAKYLGIPQVTLNYCLAGKRKPSLELIYHICDKYGVSADWLLGLSETRTPINVAVPAKALPLKPRKNPFAADSDLLTEIAAMKRRLQKLESIAILELNKPSVCVG